MSDLSDPKKNDIGLDADLADLLGSAEAVFGQKNAPDFNELFSDDPDSNSVPDALRFSEEITNTKNPSKESFPVITKFEEKEKPFFSDSDYYKKLMSGEGDIAQTTHQLLTKFMKEKDPKEKGLFRIRLITAYWEFAGKIASKIGPEMEISKRLLLRFGMMLPALLDKTQQSLLSRIIFENNLDEPVYYVDEWLYKVSEGEISSSSTDEIKNEMKKRANSVKASLEKAKGAKNMNFTLLQNKLDSITEKEKKLLSYIKMLTNHAKNKNFPALNETYTRDQHHLFSNIQETLKDLSQADREADIMYENLRSAVAKLCELEAKAKESEKSTALNMQEMMKEFMTVKQMHKMCVGRKGNHLPFLLKQYMRSNINDIATRENVIKIISEFESIDPNMFKRTFKRQTTRIVPYIILIPCYGDFGICWEPYDKFNKAASRGRIAIPIFTKNLKKAIIYALGDLRWQIAKETASYYWMQEGLTGQFYQWFTDLKMKGDVKEEFIKAYELWLTKESDGVQKLEKEIRGIFWRNIPFPQPIKDKLKLRGFAYSELCKKDMNIAMSDGY